MAEEKHVIYTVLIVILLVAAIGGFMIFSEQRAGRAFALSNVAPSNTITYQQPTYPQPVYVPPTYSQPPTQSQPTQTAAIGGPAPGGQIGGGALDVRCQHIQCANDDVCRDKEGANCGTCFHYKRLSARGVCTSDEEKKCADECRDGEGKFTDCNAAAATAFSDCKTREAYDVCSSKWDVKKKECADTYAACLIKCGLPDPSGWYE